MKYIETKINREKKQAILESIEDVTGVPREYFEFKRTRKPEEVLLRTLYVYMLKKTTGWSLNQIAYAVGLKDHTGPLVALRNIDDWMSVPQAHKEKIELLNQIEQEYAKRNS
jgi:chromosomal replication initiation ATPase DnaA